ncbi:hypothetical protein J27TS8_29010 [Robertmurraya siralis]|uniref:DUF418 domain-containing protein n=2 Tax=Robertmurraya siralis TaxID=77777 RepID=A0A919WIZ6_9BACI|nr:hypothetical protein CHH80_09995 [Bacillus sp. 7504-2]GIN62908.1 hypothetical protein J27TS8_29010 [Robertmurraya siralis]
MNTSKTNRIISLDMMRGFSIFGIFLVNMLSFHSPMLYLNPATWWEAPFDRGSYVLIDIFAQGSFYPLFSLLFGYGLVLLYERTAGRGNAFAPIAFRRLGVLLVFGMIHAFFIWHGDILINYAVFGFLLLLFIRGSGVGMTITGGLMWFIPQLIFSLLLLISAFLMPELESTIYQVEKVKHSIEVYQGGSLAEIFSQRWNDWYMVNNFGNGIIMLFSIFPFFLIGGGAAKLRWMERVAELRRPLMISFFLFFLLGLFLKLCPYIFQGGLAFEYIQDSLGGPLLAVSYAIVIALAADTIRGRKLLSFLAPVGQMSLSNYLLQSVISTTIFYSYGFGLYNQISVFSGSLLVCVIFALQVIFSSYWMKTHQFGPMEWVWRSATYKKWQRWKK